MVRSTTAQESRLEDILTEVFDKDGEEGVMFSVFPSRVDGEISSPPGTEPFDFTVECLYRHADQVLLPEGVRDVFSDYLFSSRFGSYEQVNVWRFPGGVLKGTIRCPEDDSNDESNALFVGEAWLSDKEAVLDALEKTLKDHAIASVIRPTLERLSRCAGKDPEGVSRVIDSIRKGEPLPMAIVIPAVHKEQGRDYGVLSHEESLVKLRRECLATSEDRRYPRDWHVVSVRIDRDTKNPDREEWTPTETSRRFPVLSLLCSRVSREEAEMERQKTFGDDDPESLRRRALESYPTKMERGVVLSTEEVRMLPYNFSHYGLDADFTAESLRRAVGTLSKEAGETLEEEESASPGM